MEAIKSTEQQQAGLWLLVGDPAPHAELSGAFNHPCQQEKYLHSALGF